MTREKLNSYIGKLYRGKKREGLFFIFDTEISMTHGMFFKVYALESGRILHEYASVVLSPEWTEIL